MVLSSDPEIRARQLAKINALTGGKKGVPSDAFQTRTERLDEINKGIRESDLKIHNVRTIEEKDMGMKEPQEFTLVTFKNDKEVRLKGKLSEKEAVKQALEQMRKNPNWRM